MNASGNALPTSLDFPESFFRVSVKGLLVLDGRLLLVKEPPELSGTWELPGGGLEFGENPQAGLMREIAEETSLQVVTVSKDPKYAWTAHFENHRGIEWYYSLVLCYEIQLKDFDFKPSEECEEIGFFSQTELKFLELHHQSEPLREIFDPKDFSEFSNFGSRDNLDRAENNILGNN